MSNPTINNHLLNISEYRSRHSILASMPQYVMVELTQKCNLVCPMCRKSKKKYSNRTMPQDVFTMAATELFPTAELVDLRGWGESLLLKNFVPALMTTAMAVKNIRIVTNLSFECSSALRALSQVGAYVVVSLDSADHKILGKLRRGSDLQQVTVNLKTLANLYLKRWGTTSRLSINCTMQRPALKGLSSLVRLAADCHVHKVRLAAVRVPDNSPLSLREAEHEVDLALSEMVKTANKLGVKLYASTRIGTLAAKFASNMPCLHPWAYVYISYDGKVGFCDHLIGPNFTTCLIGDMKKDRFKTIWNGTPWVEIRRMHSSDPSLLDKNLPKCRWCYRNRFVEVEDLFLPEKCTEKFLLNEI